MGAPSSNPATVGPSPPIYAEPWPAGGWVVRLEGNPVPVSRHDTEDEALFTVAAYGRVLARGHRLAFHPGETGD